MHVTTATLAFRPGGPPLAADPTGRSSPTGGTLLEDLLARRDLGVPAILIMFSLAVAVGALHALGPGHGKTLIGASLGGSEATLRHAVTVGVAVSVMHTASVLGLGLVVATAERLVSPERVYPWLGLVAGLAAVGLGARLLVTRLRALSAERRHGHRHVVPLRPLSRAGLIALAFSGGILPSPSALVVLLGAISIGRAALGLLLIAAFSLGLAASLVLVGAIAVRIGRLGRSRLPAGIVRWAPVASAASIAMLGLVVAARGLAGA
jgi:ABC-type nickel/cobalt efflux system permease component RcnA